MTIADITLAVLTFSNSLRFAVYIPQITRAIRDQRGAEAISFAAWSMFLISHASAMTETLVDNEQWTVGFMFWGNVIGCSAMLFIAVATARAARKSASYSAVPIRGTMGSRLNEVTAMATYKGKCFCGAVQLEASGEPEGMGYCHCRSCRSWSGGPVNAFTLWKPGAVRVTAGVEYIGTFQKTALSQRQYCRKCGGHLMTNHPPLGLVDVFAATLPTVKFSPGVHVNYVETVLPMRDGLPKFKDFPAEFGGSGDQTAE